MKPACVKARVARKSRGQQCPYGFDSRPKHINPSQEILERGFVSSEMLLIPPAGHKIGKNVSKWRSRTRFEHEIGENVSESVVNGHFEHKIDEKMRESSNYSIPLDAECTSK